MTSNLIFKHSHQNLEEARGMLSARNVAKGTIIVLVILLSTIPVATHAGNNTINSTVVNNPVQFEGLNQVQSAGNDSAIGVTDNPPDVQVAAGPNHIVEIVNSEVAIYSKPQGTLFRKMAVNTFFKAGNTDFVFDPKVLFDASSQTWFASIGDCPNFLVNSQCNTGVIKIAVSTSTDPRQAWNIYTVGPSTGYSDQPILGISDNLVVISANDFPGFNSNAYNGAQYWVLEKADMVAGINNVHNQTFGPDTTLFAVHPVQSLSSTTTQYMVTAINAGALNTTGGPANRIELFSLSGTPPSVTVSTTVFTVQTLRQPPTGIAVNADDGRVSTAAWRNGKLWLGSSDGCVPTRDTQTRSCVFLARIDTSSLSMLQNFTFATNGVDQYYPALSIDSSGNLGLIYGYSNSTGYPSLGLTGQLTTDPLNSLARAVTLRAGTAPDPTSRYGDYFGAGVDPSDPTVIWTAGEYHHAINFHNKFNCPDYVSSCTWFTAIGALTLFQPDFSITAPSNVTCPKRGCNYTVNVTSLHDFSGIVSLNVTSVPGGATVTITPSAVNVGAGSTSPATVSVSTTTSITVTVTGTSGNLRHSVSTSITQS